VTAILAVRMAPGAQRIRASRSATPVGKGTGEGRGRPARHAVAGDGGSGAVEREAPIFFFFPVPSVTRRRTNRRASGCGESRAALRSPSAALGSPAALKPRRSEIGGGSPSLHGGRTGGHGRNHLHANAETVLLITKAHCPLASANVAGPQRFTNKQRSTPNGVLTTPALSPKQFKGRKADAR
jgi:hypothetical protein